MTKVGVRGGFVSLRSCFRSGLRVRTLAILASLAVVYRLSGFRTGLTSPVRPLILRIIPQP
jgi:hypothetical protein